VNSRVAKREVETGACSEKPITCKSINQLRISGYLSHRLDPRARRSRTRLSADCARSPARPPAARRRSPALTVHRAITPHTVHADVDVDVEIEDFDSDDLIELLEDRGFVVFDEHDMKARETNSDRILWQIRQSYITDTPENFRKFLELKFLDMDIPV
jgi:hypothetical protein